MKAIPLLVAALFLFSTAQALAPVMVFAGNCLQDTSRCTNLQGVAANQQVNSYIQGADYGGILRSAPAAGKVISIIGDPREGHTHQGIDIANAIGTPIRAAGDGVVTSAKNIETGLCGVYVRIDHSNGLHTVYCHLKLGSLTVHERQHVRAGEVIGLMDNTGNARHTVTHLHFEVRRGQDVLNPCSFYSCQRSSRLV